MALFGKKKNEPLPIEKARILSVEDQTFIRELVGRLLKQIGVQQVLMARSAEDALYNLTKNPRMADVVLLDFGLPGMSGLKFLERLRDKSAPKKLQNLPVVILTGEMDDRLFRKMSKLKISGFLRKPVNEATLKAALERALRHEIIKEATQQVEFEPSPTSDAEERPMDTVNTGKSEPVADPPQLEKEEMTNTNDANQTPKDPEVDVKA